MTAPRDVEAIRADVRIVHAAPLHLDSDGAYRGPGPTTYALARLFADVEPLLARLAAADQQNAELRAELERLSQSQFAVGQALVNEQLRSERAESQLAVAREQCQELGIGCSEARAAQIAAEARLEAVRAEVTKVAAGLRSMQFSKYRSTPDWAWMNAGGLANRLAAALSAPQPEPIPWGQPLPAMTPEEFRREREGRWALPEPPASDEEIEARFQKARREANERASNDHDCVPEGCSECRPPASDEPARTKHRCGPECCPECCGCMPTPAPTAGTMAGRADGHAEPARCASCRRPLPHTEPEQRACQAASEPARCGHDHRQAFDHDYDAGNRCRCCGISFGQIGGSGICPGPAASGTPDGGS